MSAKLKSLQTKLGLVPKQHLPLSDNMQRIARQQERQAPAPAPADPSGLGEAFDALLQQRIDEALAGERQQHAAEIQQLREQIKQQPQQPRPPKGKEPMEFTRVIRRDELGRIWVTETTVEGEDGKIIIEITKRDELGSIVSSRAFHLAAGEVYKPGKPGLPGPREYRPGVPRKLYGNDPEV